MDDEAFDPEVVAVVPAYQIAAAPLHLAYFCPGAADLTAMALWAVMAFA